MEGTTHYPKITAAGLAAAINASNTGVELAITHVSYGTGLYDPTGAESALQNEVARVPVAAGARVTPTQVRVYAVWSAQVGPHNIGEIGFWAGSTLFAVWSRSTGGYIAVKTPEVPFVQYFNLALSVVPPGSITVLADTGQSLILAMLAEHETDNDPHPNFRAWVQQLMDDHDGNPNAHPAIRQLIANHIASTTDHAHLLRRAEINVDRVNDMTGDDGALIADVNYNALILPGIYFAGIGSTNAPKSAVFSVHVTRGENATGTTALINQLAIEISTGLMWSRSSVTNGANWSKWQQSISVPTTGLVPTTTNANSLPIGWSNHAYQSNNNHPFPDGQYGSFQAAILTIPASETDGETLIQIAYNYYGNRMAMRGNYPTGSGGVGDATWAQWKEIYGYYSDVRFDDGVFSNLTLTGIASALYFNNRADPDGPDKFTLYNDAMKLRLSRYQVGVTQSIDLSDFFSKTHNTNGSQSLPGGLILQWITVSGSEDSWAAYNFPSAFPNACFAVLGSMSGGSANSGQQNCYARPVNRFQFEVMSNEFVPTITIWAIGN